jgi:hypothetical protein
MESTLERPYKIVRALPDGQRVLIGTYEDMREAKKRIADFSEYWPGDYVIVPPTYEQRADLHSPGHALQLVGQKQR